jgi:prepilin-type N-terminal cleavage/methylation domain-containing protein
MKLSARCLLKSGTGFTLIELLLVVSIMLIMGTSSVVFFSRFLTQNAVANTQDRLVGQLRKAQIYAMMGKENGSWGVRFESNTIVLFQGNSYAARNTAFDETFKENSSISISGFSEIIFSKTTGIPSVSGTYTITGNDSSKQVIVNSQGVVSR